MQRFFVEPSQIDEGAHQIHITGSDVKHIVNVAADENRGRALDQ